MLDAATVVATLRRLTEALPPPAHCWVAYSGGLDSHVLLHVLASQGVPALRALHIDHGLHPDSRAWAEHCQQICRELGIAYCAVRVDASAKRGESPEAAARIARYAAFMEQMVAGDWLLTAQHRDDQLETVLLQLLRGAGPKGLAAMPEHAPLGAGHQVRPLLDFDRDEIVQYAQRHGLKWLDDPSNSDTRFDRNYLRGEVIPVLRARWPSLTRTVARSARLSAAAAESLAREAQADLASIVPASSAVLPVGPLLELGGFRAREVLRLWLSATGGPIPSEKMLHRIIHELAGARRDAEPMIELGDCSLRRFRGAIHCVPALPDEQRWQRDWPDPGAPLELPHGLGTLYWQAPPSKAGLRVSPRRGGERLVTAGSGPGRALKDVLREQGWPPWLRPLLPLVRDSKAQLVAVPGVTPGLRWLKPDGSPW